MGGLYIILRVITHEHTGFYRYAQPGGRPAEDQRMRFLYLLIAADDDQVKIGAQAAVIHLTVLRIAVAVGDEPQFVALLPQAG